MKTRLFELLICLLFPWISFSCKSDGDLELNDVKDTEISIYFRLAVDGSVNQLSRGTWNDNLDADQSNNYTDQIGSAFDNKIQTGSLRVLIYKDTELVGAVEDLVCYPLSSAGTQYKFVGRIPKNRLDAGIPYKFMVFANSLSVDVDATFGIDDIQYGDQQFIPMWGVNQMTLGTKDGKLESKYDLGVIYLLRSVAKVQVGLSEEMSRLYTLTDVHITYANDKGYVCPESWDRVTKTTELLQENGGYTASFNPFPSEYPTKYSFSEEVSGKKYLIYLPEFENSEEREAVIVVTITDKNGRKIQLKDNTIQFTSYQLGSSGKDVPFCNIVRNFNYRFTISNILTDNRLSLIFKVNPWSVNEESWDYTKHVSVSRQIKWKEGTYNSVDPVTGTVVVKPGQKLECTFTIDTPVGAKWYASFIPLKGNLDAFRFYSEEYPDGATEMTGELGKEAILTIGPARADIVENNYALLKIVVRTPDGRTILVKSLMPEESTTKEGFTIIQSK